MTEKEKDKLFEKQALGRGFCGTCGEGLGTITKDDIKLFGRCPVNGDHGEATLNMPSISDPEVDELNEF